MIQPKNHIAVRIEVRPGDGYRLVCIIGEYGQRARRVEPNAPDSSWVDVMLANSALDGQAYTSPDIGRGLFLWIVRQLSRSEEEAQAYIVTLLGLPETNIL